MKTLKLMMFFMALAATPLFTSCGDDDKNPPAPADPSGFYAGTITALSASNPAGAVVEKTGDTYLLSLEDLALTPFPNATIDIGDVTFTDVAYDNGALSGGSQLQVEVTLPDALLSMPGVTSPELTLGVALASGTVAGDNLKFTLTVSNVPVMNSVSVSFDGNKQVIFIR